MTPQARRNYPQAMVELQVSERRSCELAAMSRSGYRYQRVARDGDERLKADLRVIAEEHPAAGYRTAWVLFRREGHPINHKRVQRLWQEAGLTQPRRRKCRRQAGVSVPVKATHADHVWAHDFIHDRTVGGRALRMLTVEDEYTPEGLALEVGRSMPAGQVKAVLRELFAQRQPPGYIRSDNGPEFIAHELTGWLTEQGVQTHHIAPGSPWQNEYGESFIATLRRECPNQEPFHGVPDARTKSGLWWRRDNRGGRTARWGTEHRWSSGTG
ncbi:MAG: IS3 family transposase [Candidatus Thermoplasmatota archaeon]|nr:IS3 family transposase [Candidatus Thermoplasmatota archaeon]